MSTTPALADAYRFGRFELRPAQRLLLADGAPLPVGARAFDLLQALVVERDRVVSHDELLARVWPGMVVEENNLRQHVSALRKLLGAQALATVPGRGYRFTLPLEEGRAPLAAPPVASARRAWRSRSPTASARISPTASASSSWRR
jgi:DNA-binding winged helix-turn-helix (wHTH) protein